MNRLLSLLLLAAATLASGCAMCSTPYDCHYPAYGGSTPRGDRVHGRVGSAFNDAAAQPVELVEGEYFDGQIVDGEIITDQFTDGQIIEEQVIGGEVVEGEILQGEIITGESEIIQGEIIESYMPMGSEIIDLPSVGTESSGSAPMSLPVDDGAAAAPQIDLRDVVDHSVEGMVDLNPSAPESLAVPRDVPLNPLNSNSPVPVMNSPTMDSPLNDAPLNSLDRILDGLPHGPNEPTIQLSPAVMPY